MTEMTYLEIAPTVETEYPPTLSWSPAEVRIPTGKTYEAIVTCSVGHSSLLGASSGHTIADDGTVTPSVLCPVAACGWHEHIRLASWSPE